MSRSRQGIKVARKGIRGIEWRQREIVLDRDRYRQVFNYIYKQNRVAIASDNDIEREMNNLRKR